MRVLVEQQAARPTSTAEAEPAGGSRLDAAGLVAGGATLSIGLPQAVRDGPWPREDDATRHLQLPPQSVRVSADVVRRLAARVDQPSGRDCWREIRSQFPQEPAALQQPLQQLFAAEHAFSNSSLYRMATAESSELAESLQASVRQIRLLSTSLEQTIDQARAQVGRQAWLHLVSTRASMNDLNLD
jgi:hypothetical protein